MSASDLELDAVAERNFHAKLLQIDGDLHQADIQALKFLFKDKLQKSKLAKMNSGHELFTALETSKLITAKDPCLLVEAFKTIGRLDLIDYLDIDEDQANNVTRTGNISDYRHMMFDIAQDLTKEDTYKMAFLAEKISKAKREKLTSPLDLFNLMEESKLISSNNLGVLQDYVKSLNRRDLVDRLIKFCESQGSGDGLKMSGSARCLRTASMETMDTTETTQSVRKTVNGLPESMRLDLSSELLKQPTSHVAVLWKELGFSNENLREIDKTLKYNDKALRCQKLLESAPLLHGIKATDALIKFINALRFADLIPLSRQLIAKFKDHLPREYVQDVERHRRGEDNQNMEISMEEASQSIQSPPRNKSLSTETLCLHQSSFLPTYKMDAIPRGICVIINNMIFRCDWSPEERLKDRIGSNIDAEKLKNVFHNLHFEVESLDNLSAQEMVQNLERISEKVTSQHDCFVCCILTHGKSGDEIYGCDGCIVNMSALQNPFKATRCKQLAGKPKLFFMQACQGKEKQQGSQVHSDVAMETDGPSDAVTVPDEADFLIGYATAPGFVSYRSKTQGSWYMNILTDLLEKYATTTDLLTILTRVNHEVGKKNADFDGITYKQSPAPQFTLRKKVIFKKPSGESHE